MKLKKLEIRCNHLIQDQAASHDRSGNGVEGSQFAVVPLDLPSNALRVNFPAVYLSKNRATFLR